jgi:hypothetical protein
MPKSAEAWARSVRRNYELSDTEQKLLELAVAPLRLAQDNEARPVDRLAAMSRYQSLVKQLDLENASDDGKTEETFSPTADIRTWPRRVS